MDGGLHSNNFLITERCGDAARRGGRWCYTPTGTPVATEHPATGPGRTTGAQRITSYHSATTKHTNDHSTMTKWPAWYSNIRIQCWGAKPEMDPR